MIRHLLKLVWSRKRANALLILEIGVSFVVLFAVSTVGLIMFDRVHRPLGFHWDRLYNVSIDEREFDERAVTERQAERTAQVVKALEALEEVETVALVTMAPFELGYSSDELEYEGRSVGGDLTDGDDHFAEALGLEVVQGRWFEPADDALDWTPVVINRLMADALFGGDDPIGQTVSEDPPRRVVGVVEAFRKNGPYSKVEPAYIRRASLTKAGGTLPRRLLVKVRAPSGELEQRLVEVMRRAEPEWTYNIELTETIRERNSKFLVAPLMVGVLVAAFLMIMVVLGMIGVFWQSVTQRVGEIGLRRAVGGPRSRIYRQILGEVLIVTGLGALIACVLILNGVLLGLTGSVTWPTILTALALSLVLMIALTTTSGLYPAWLAARIQPADALHDE